MFANYLQQGLAHDPLSTYLNFASGFNKNAGQVAQNALMNATTASTQENTKLAPQKMDLQNAILAHQVQRFGPQYALIKAAQNPIVQKLLNSNKDLATRYATAIAQLAAAAQNPSGNIPAPNTSNGATSDNSTIPGANPVSGAPPISQPQAAQIVAANNSTPTITADDISKLQDTAGSEAIKKTVPANIQTQRYFSKSADNLMQQIPWDKLGGYAGLAGKLGITGNRALASMNGVTPQDYVAYNNFIHTQLPALANEIRRSLGGQATNEETELMNNMVNPVYVDNNFPQVLSQVQALKNSLEANKAAIFASPQQISEGKGGVIPSELRNNKEALRAYFQNQTADRQRAILAELKAGG